MPLRTTARMTALRPGQSPPPVRTPTRMARFLQRIREAVADSDSGGQPTGPIFRESARVRRQRAGQSSSESGRAGDLRGVAVVVFSLLLAARLQLLFRLRRVDIHVLLAGQAHELVHDLVGNRA